MYAVGRVGTYIAQGVYTFSGPFHPFGGAVDIIVVQQEDGTFKSSPWYVKFGKFQGVLKRREKKVLVAVNDVEANFHMYLDHKGEAYFLKDDASPEIDEFAALSANEAASSGDESSVRHLAIEYPKGEEGQDAKADNDKEESEDERGDDLELRFEGREASKQLIQQSVEERAAAAALELAFAHQHQENKVAGVDGLKVSEDEDTNPLDNLTSLYLERGSSADACRSEPLTNETEFPAFLNQVLDLEASQASSACSGNGAFTLLSTAPVSEAKTSPENSEPDRIPPSNNGMVVHGLLNKALGLQDSENSGPGNALLASATLNSLARVVVNNQPISSIRNYTGPKLVELSEDDVGGTEEKDGMPRSTETNLTSEEGSFPEDSGGAPTCIDQSLTDVKAVDTVTTSVNLSVVEIQPKSVDTTLPSVLLPLTSGPDAHGSEHPNLLKVTNIEIIDESLPIESPGQTNYLAGKIPHKVQESIPAYSRDTIENGVHLESLDDTKELLERPRVSQDSTSKNGVQEGKLGIPKKEKDPLAGSEDTEPQQTVVVPNVQSQVLDEKVKATGAPKTVTESSRSEKIAVAESMKEVVMQQPEKVTEMVSTSTEKFTDVGSPRHKAAIELEMSWREVMEKAAVALKSAPLTGKDYSRSRSLARVVGSDSGQRKASEEMGGLPEQAEKKSWLWFHWGGSSVPQAKQSVDDVRNDNGNSRKIVELGEDEAEKDQTGKKASLEDAATRNTLDKHDLGFNLETENLGSASGREVQAMGDAKLGECKSTVEAMRTENNDVASRSKAEEDGDTADIRSQPKAGSSGSKRRSIFGMLSRSNTNQSSLSATSSIKSTDDVQDFAEGLKRVTSIERAESVVDLLDTKWARGEGPKGLMAVARVPDSKVSKHSVNKNLEVGIFQVDKEGSESVPTSLDDLSSGVVVQIPAPDVEKNGVIDTVDSSTTCADSTVPQALVKLVLDQVDEHIRANPSDSDKDSRSAKATGVEATEGEVDDVGVESPLTISQTNQDAGEFISNRKAKVVLMSIDGHLITAPLESVDDANAQTPFESLSKKYHESVEDSECTGGSPKMAVSFAEAPEVALAPIVSRSEYLQDGEENNFAQSGTETPEEDDGQSNSSVQSDSKLDSRGSPNIEGLKVAVNNVGARQSKADSSGANDTDALARGNSKLELTSDNKEDVKFGGDVIYRSDATGSQEFDEVRARVFEKLDEPSEGESPDQSAEKYERFYSSRDLETERRPLRRNLSLYVDAFSNSSKDLSEADEGLKTPVRRNVSIYMDALSGDEDDEDEEQVESFRGNSIPIPGAFDRSRKAQSLDDIQILRAVSESLPNSGESDIHGKVLSPRLAISRSVGSEPLVLSQDLNEAVASTDGIQRSQSFSSPLSSRREDGNPLQHGRTGEMTTTTPKDTTDELNFVGQTTASAKNRIEGKGMGVAETGFRLSLCRHLLTDHMGLEAAGKAFASERVSLDDFKKSGAAIAANDKLVVQVGARYYPWVVAAPIVLGILGFGQVLIAPNEGAIPVEKPDVIADGKPSVGTLTTTSSGGWKLWPFSRSTRTPEPGTASVLLPRQADALMLATHAALKSPLTEDYLRMNGYYKKPRKVRTNSPSSVQLGSLGLKEGSNKITFTFVTRVLGKQQVDARIYLWKWNTRIVISDVDGTITRSDVLGQVMPLVGKDWTQSGVARLFSAIKKNGYELMFLSARAISQAYLTRQFLENIKQDGEVLPDGPVVISPDGLFPSLYREVIRRAPHEFKIACLEDIKSLFPPESKPFYAGFGNRDTDELSYLKVGISKGKIFIINPKGEVVVNNQVEVKSYGSLHKLVNDMFPAMTSTEQEDFNDLNFWKLPLPDIEDDQSQKSAGSSSSRRSSKVADRHQ